MRGPIHLTLMFSYIFIYCSASFAEYLQEKRIQIADLAPLAKLSTLNDRIKELIKELKDSVV